MVVEFTNTLEDIKAFTTYHYEHSPLARRQRIIIQLVMTFVFVVAFGVTVLLLTGSPANASPVRYIVFIVVGLIGAIVVFFRSQSRMERATAQNAVKMYQEGKNVALLEQRCITIDADGVKEKSPSAESFVRWTSIEKVAVTTTHLFLYISAISALAIPRRAFADETQWNEFVTRAQSYKQAADTPSS